jgi:hypothetical protein
LAHRRIFVDENFRTGSKMKEKDLEILITTDDPGEDTLGEDTFHQHSTNKITTPPNEQQTTVAIDTEYDG